MIAKVEELQETINPIEGASFWDDGQYSGRRFLVPQDATEVELPDPDTGMPLRYLRLAQIIGIPGTGFEGSRSACFVLLK